ncbi:MAG TPA: serine/threonine-protein kinase [Polyangiaceae bacterium]|nr:serine/threonine-protein kinase [Polyangiaceae bacterium]
MGNSEPPVPQGVVAGKYRLTRLLGRGGMGTVWEGTHLSLGTRVAVKFIDAGYAQSPEARARFENEARAAARLRSKHVVEVYDHGVSDDGCPFIVMEFLEGEPLDKRLDRLGRLPAKETAQIVMQIGRALTKAHAANIVHRDLKPENVFLVWDDEEGTDVVKVVDFGIAKFNEASLGSSSCSATRTGSLLGTPHYMSPEQARGLRSVDSRSDLWSIAVIAYRCIVGELPFEGEAVGDLLVKLCTAPIPVPSQVSSEVPATFDAWLEKALAREPAQRFQTAAQLSESLAAVCGLTIRGQDGGSGPYSAVGSGAFGTATPDVFFPTQLAPAAATTDPLPPALLTGAPTTQTKAPARKQARSGARAALALGALLSVGGGAFIAARLFGGPALPAVGAIVPSRSPAAIVSAPREAPLLVAAAPATQATQAPPPTASVSARSEATVAPRPVVLRPLAQRPEPKPVRKPTPTPSPKPTSDLGF